MFVIYDAVMPLKRMAQDPVMSNLKAKNPLILAMFTAKILNKLFGCYLLALGNDYTYE